MCWQGLWYDLLLLFTRYLLYSTTRCDVRNSDFINTEHNLIHIDKRYYLQSSLYLLPRFGTKVVVFLAAQQVDAVK